MAPGQGSSRWANPIRETHKRQPYGMEVTKVLTFRSVVCYGAPCAPIIGEINKVEAAGTVKEIYFKGRDLELCVSWCLLAKLAVGSTQATLHRAPGFHFQKRSSGTRQDCKGQLDVGRG